MIMIAMLLGFLTIDQVTKNMAVHNLMGKDSVVLIEKWLNFTYVENRGASFGSFYGYKYLLILLSITISAGIIYYVLKNRDRLSKKEIFCYVLIISGAIGNLIDRLSNGYVIDFIHTELGGLYDYPVFNFADIYIVIGCVLLFLYSFRKEEKDE